MMLPNEMSRVRSALVTMMACFALSNIVVNEALHSSNSEILLESFANPIHTWKEMNDPVMGGRSTGSFHVEDEIGVFQGEVVNVPFLHAPGFIQARTTDSIAFPDVSQCTALKLVVRSNNPEYAGYRVSFGNAHAPGGKMFAYGYKANLKNVPSDGEFSPIVVPFSDFTDSWDDATGDPIHTCEEKSLYCPDALTLKNMKTIAVWGEGFAGLLSLEIQSISAVGCGSSKSATTEESSTTTALDSDYSWFTRHILRGWSQQLSLSTLFLNWFWN